MPPPPSLLLGRRPLLLGGVAGLVLPWAGAAAAADAEAVLREGRPGTVVVVRHALAPGVGDPAGFRLEACGTQRNLSDEGRAQARRLGAWFRERNLAPARVRSSRWCRCLETARLAFGDGVEGWPPLDSFFEDRSAEPAKTRTLAAELGTLAAGDRRGFEVWVTHMVNLLALVDVNPASSGGAVVRAVGGRPAAVASVPPV